MSETQIRDIVAEFKEKGGAFVEDDEYITDDGDALYNPVVDRVNAEMWLTDLLEALT